MCKKIEQKNTNQSSNQAPPVLTAYALTTQPLPPSPLTVLYFWSINGFFSLIRPIVHIVKIIDLCLTNFRRFYECSIRSLKKTCAFYQGGFNLNTLRHSSVQCSPRKRGVHNWSESTAKSRIRIYVMSSPNGTKFTLELASLKGRPHSKFESDFTHYDSKV